MKPKPEKKGTLIPVLKTTAASVKECADYPRQTYDSIVQKLVFFYKKSGGNENGTDKYTNGKSAQGKR